jgi:hypothetical protein
MENLPQATNTSDWGDITPPSDGPYTVPPRPPGLSVTQPLPLHHSHTAPTSDKFVTSIEQTTPIAQSALCTHHDVPDITLNKNPGSTECEHLAQGARIRRDNLRADSSMSLACNPSSDSNGGDHRSIALLSSPRGVPQSPDCLRADDNPCLHDLKVASRMHLAPHRRFCTKSPQRSAVPGLDSQPVRAASPDTIGALALSQVSHTKRTHSSFIPPHRRLIASRLL